MARSSIEHGDTVIAKCVVIGAGIAGLAAARTLGEEGIDSLVLDKGRGVGGRMATRRQGDYRFDHGAQSFFCSDLQLADLGATWLQSGSVHSGSYPDLSGQEAVRFGPVFGHSGINVIPKTMAAVLNVRTSLRVTRLRFADSMWVLTIDESQEIRAQSLILTAPVPQALELLEGSAISLEPEQEAHLRAVTYERCLAVMAVVKGSGALIESGVLLSSHGPIRLIADNYAKGVSRVPGALTIHTDPEYAVARWDAPPETVSREILATCQQLLPCEVIEAWVHRWRYSRCVRSYPQSYTVIETPGLLALAGDGFSGTDIEGAAISGRNAARAIASRMN